VWNLEMKGKPWTVEEEKELSGLIESNASMEVIAAKLKRKPSAIYVKCMRLGLTAKPHASPASVPLPKELYSVEEALEMLAAALKTASTPGLDRAEVQRLQVVGSLAKTYKEILADYVDYRGIEAKMAEMEEKYQALIERKGWAVSSKQRHDSVGEEVDQARDSAGEA
jgi:hypothetical protein